MNSAIQRLRGAALAQPGPDHATDGDLLGRFVEHRDEAAFAAIVRRHGPMVWGLCRRVLTNHQDAEDAFQATFLVLVHKAASVRPRERLVNWLHGTAHTTALHARRTAVRRTAREKQVTETPEPAAPGHERDRWAELRPVLDEEVGRLPNKYRVLVLLCDVEGRTRTEAALQLGLPEGTVAGRLARARDLLAKRLTRRGVTLSGAVLAATLARNAAGVAPPSLVSSTLDAASTIAAGRVAAPGVISGPVAALTEGVLNGMVITKLMRGVVAVVVSALVALGGSVLARQIIGADRPAGPVGPVAAPAPEEPAPGRPLAPPAPGAHAALRQQLEADEWTLTAVDPDRRTITVTEKRDRPDAVWLVQRGAGTRVESGAGLSLSGLGVDADARVTCDGRPATLADLRPGMKVALRLRPGQMVADAVAAVVPELPERGYELTAVDPGRRLISVKVVETQLAMEPLHLAPNAEVTVYGVRPGNTLFSRAGTVEDLKAGRRVGLELTIGTDGRVEIRKITTSE